MSAKLGPYKKSLDYSYAIGVYPTLELLAHQPERVVRVLVSSAGGENEGVARIRELCQRRRLYADVADAAIARIAGQGNVYAIGVFRKYEAALDSQADHLALVNPSDAGNLGTILRTMLAFGLADLAIIEPAVDLYDPKTVRASMGALFQVRAARFASLADYRRRFAHHFYPFMTDGEHALGEVDWQPPVALVFGNEGAGLAPEVRALGTSVRIPHSDRVDSLNLAVAVGIALHAFSSRRGAP